MPWRCPRCGPCSGGIPDEAGRQRCARQGCDERLVWQHLAPRRRKHERAGEVFRAEDDKKFTAIQKRRTAQCLSAAKQALIGREAAREGREILRAVEARERAAAEREAAQRGARRRPEA